jgi:predicted O-methyltransferase YrrM
VNVIQRLKSVVVKFRLGRKARDFYWKGREPKVNARGWEARHLREAFPLPAPVEKAMVQTLITIRHHWCPPEKPRVLASLIVRDKIKRSVEIGVFTGASFVAQAVAARHVGGLAVGIDPYSEGEAEQEDNSEILEPIREQRRNRDWNAIYAGMLQMLEDNSLSASSRILRMTSAEAADVIEAGVGLVHIDGNHDYLKVQSDIARYVPKLKPGGYLVLDDIGWPTIQPQYYELRKSMAVIYEDPGRWACLAKRE